MKRKKKFPKMKRALPLALVVVMMMTMFVVSASAHTVAGVEICHFDPENDCPQQTYDVYEINELVENSELLYACPTCGNVYRIQFERFTFSVETETQYLIVYIFDNADDDGEYNDVAVAPSEDGLNNFDWYGQSRIVNIELVSGSGAGSMVGEMTDTITTSFGGLLKGVGASIVNFFDKTVIAENGGLTTLATWTLAFLGIGFGFMVVKFITNKVRKK